MLGSKILFWSFWLTGMATCMSAIAVELFELKCPIASISIRGKWLSSAEEEWLSSSEEEEGSS